MKLRSLLCVLLLILVLALAGAEQRPVARELSDMEFVRAMGVDYCPEGVRLTASVSSDTQEKKSAIMLASEAETLTRAVDQIQSYTSKFIFFGYVSHYLVGEDAAKEDIRPLLDYMERDLYMRLDTAFYVVRDQEAGTVIEAVAADGDSISQRLDSLQKDAGLLLVPVPITLREFIASLDRNGCAVATALELVEKRPGDESTDEEDRSDSGKTMRPFGYAIFQDYRLRGYIEESDLLGLNLLLNRPLMATVEIEGTSGHPVALTVTSDSSEVLPVLEHDELTGLRIVCRVTADLAEVQGIENVVTSIGHYEAAASRLIRQKVSNVLAQSQLLNADFLGLEELVEQKEPTLWKKTLEDHWEEVFPTLDIQVEVSVKVSRTYESLQTMGGPEE